MAPRVTKSVRQLLAFLFAIGLVAAGAGVALWATSALTFSPPFNSDSETRDSQIIKSITREEQVALLSLGVQGIEERAGNSEFLGMDVPGSERATFIQYSFNAKLGVEGKDVAIEQTGEDAYLVTIPEFIFIGHSDEEFKLVAENNGILSFITPEIDSVDMINNILNLDTQKKYIGTNKNVLKDQVKAFYTGIISSIDPNISVSFRFR